MCFLPNWRIVLSPLQKYPLEITLSIRDGE